MLDAIFEFILLFIVRCIVFPVVAIIALPVIVVRLAWQQQLTMRHVLWDLETVWERLDSSG